jgi:hypothetical protein
MTAPADVPPIVARLAQAIDRVVWERTGPLLAAGRVLSDPQVAEAFAALSLLETARARHKPVRWAADSAVVVCSCGSGDYESCKERLALEA